MELNVPTSGAVSHESPAVVQLHEDTKVPVSEIKAKLHDKIMDLNNQRLAKPSEVPFGHTIEDMKDQSFKDVENELLHPEEQENPQDEEFKDIFGDVYPGADAFNAPVEDNGTTDNFGSDFGGGDFGGGIDNNAMGFSDTDMDTLNATADNAFDDFTGEEGTETAGDVNNISAEEPGATEENATDTATDSPSETPAEPQADEPVAV